MQFTTYEHNRAGYLDDTWRHLRAPLANLKPPIGVRAVRAEGPSTYLWFIKFFEKRRICRSVYGG
jgi:hypothetical protein